MTPDLLAEAGYKYLLDWCMDDQPGWHRDAIWLTTPGAIARYCIDLPSGTAP